MKNELLVLTDQGIVWINKSFNTTSYSSRQSGNWNVFHQYENPEIIVEKDSFLPALLAFSGPFTFSVILMGKKLSEEEEINQES